MTSDAKFKLQTAEFDAAAHLSEQYRRLTLTPIVDDDYPQVRFEYDQAVRCFLEACAANGHKMPQQKVDA